MNNRDLSALITKLNSGRGTQLVVRVPISPHVDFSKVWTRPQKLGVPPASGNQPHSFYFVRDAEGQYVSCVYDMVSDLHGYTLRQHRRKGHMKRALADVIIPHILGRREELLITIQTRDRASEKASQALARSLGFLPLNGEDEPWTYCPQQRPTAMQHPSNPMSAEEIELWRSKIHQAKESILAAAELFTLHYGEVEAVRQISQTAYAIGNDASYLADNLLEGHTHILDQ